MGLPIHLLNQPPPHVCCFQNIFITKKKDYHKHPTVYIIVTKNYTPHQVFVIDENMNLGRKADIS